MTQYSFRRMTPVDLPMVNNWLTTPDVQKWWIDADGNPTGAFGEEELEAPNVSMSLVLYQDRPFAFIQSYDPHAWTDHHFASLPVGSRGIDQFIGEPQMIGHGHGTELIRIYVETLFLAGAPAVGADPHPINGRAVRAYERAGFQRGPETTTEWGRSIAMTRFAEPA